MHEGRRPSGGGQVHAAVPGVQQARTVTSREQTCFRKALRALRRERIDPNGGCLEASAEIVCCLRAQGVAAKLVRRELSRQRGGHWTFETANGEFDPTIAFWTDKPTGIKRGSLYAITPKSPHRKWRRDNAIDERTALRIGVGPKAARVCVLKTR